MRGTRFSHIRWVAETGSTNADLMRQAATGGGEQVLITDLQTAGRGRRGRVWEAPPRSSILMSVLVRDRPPSEAFWAVGAVALGAAEAISEHTDIDCTLKWPNDLLVGEAKVGGVLAQLVDNVVVIGIGINVNWPDTPPEAVERASAADAGRPAPTALNHHRRDMAEIDRAPLVVAILTRAIRWLEADGPSLHTAWKARCSTVGRMVRLELAGESAVGQAVDVGESGALVLACDGLLTSHEVGDVVHLHSNT